MHADDHLRHTAELQHGLIAFDQALEVLTRHHVTRRVIGGEWERLSRHVLRVVGAPRTQQQRLMAAVLDAGHGAVVAHTSAPVLWRLPGVREESVELSRERGASGRRPTLARLHETRWLPEHHVTSIAGIPVTTLPRTLFDLAGRLPARRTERLVDTVVAKSPGTLRSLHSMLAEHAARGRNGITVMRQILDDRPVGVRREETGLERRVNQILREAGEHPLTPQVDVGGHEWIGRVDFTDDKAPRVLYEVDSRLHHTSKLDRLHDAERDAALLAAGFRTVVRIPEEHVWYEPWKVVEVVRSNRRMAA